MQNSVLCRFLGEFLVYSELQGGAENGQDAVVV